MTEKTPPPTFSQCADRRAEGESDVEAQAEDGLVQTDRQHDRRRPYHHERGNIAARRERHLQPILAPFTPYRSAHQAIRAVSSWPHPNDARSQVH